MRKTYREMGLEHCDARNKLFFVSSGLLFLDVCLLLAHLVDQNVLFYSAFLYTLALHVILFCVLGSHEVDCMEAFRR